MNTEDYTLRCKNCNHSMGGENLELGKCDLCGYIDEDIADFFDPVQSLMFEINHPEEVESSRQILRDTVEKFEFWNLIKMMNIQNEVRERGKTLDQLKTERFADTRTYRNWINYINEDIRLTWSEMTDGERAFAFIVAYDAAMREK